MRSRKSRLKSTAGFCPAAAYLSLKHPRLNCHRGVPVGVLGHIGASLAFGKSSASGDSVARKEFAMLRACPEESRDRAVERCSSSVLPPDRRTDMRLAAEVQQERPWIR